MYQSSKFVAFAKENQRESTGGGGYPYDDKSDESNDDSDPAGGIIKSKSKHKQIARSQPQKVQSKPEQSLEEIQKNDWFNHFEYKRNLYDPILSKIQAPVIAGLQPSDQLKDSFVRGAIAKMEINRIPINFRNENLEHVIA